MDEGTDYERQVIALHGQASLQDHGTGFIVLCYFS